MKGPNLSAIAVKEPSVTLFLLLATMAAGIFAFFQLGRAEDPSFTLKVLTVTAVWPGASAREMQDQVADRLEKGDVHLSGLVVLGPHLTEDNHRELLEQAIDEAAHEVWAALRPGAPAFESLSGDALFARLNQSNMAAVITAMHAHEPVADDLLRGSALEYESEAGRWYVETYQIAVAEAVRAAGRRVAESLSR